jgi:hypothetical protein
MSVLDVAKLPAGLYGAENPEGPHAGINFK